MSDSIIALIGVVFGWGLSQLTDLIRSNLRIKKLKKVISIELSDIEKALALRIVSTKETAENFINGNYMITLGAPVHTPILDSYYVEIAEHFSENQRYNLNTFKDHLSAFNKTTEWALSGGTPSNKAFQNAFRFVELHRQTSFAYALLKEANQNGGENKVDDNHNSYEAIKQEIDALFKQIRPN